MKKNLIVTFTVVTAISLGILTGCGAYQQANADPLTQPTTQIEQMVEDEHQENEASGDVSGNETQETTESTQESSTESSAQDENQDNVTSYHTETQTIHHDAVTHTEQQLVRAAWDETVVDKAAWDETAYKTEQRWVDGAYHEAVTHTVRHEGGWHGSCDDCGAEFDDQAAADAHCIANDHLSGYSGRSTDPWDEVIVDQAAYDEPGHYEDVQVPYTIHHDAVTHVVHHEAEYKTVTVVDKEAWDEEVEVQVPNN